MDLKNLSEIDFNEIAESFKNLDPENAGSWPVAVKLAVFVAVFVGVIFLGNYFFITEKKNTLANEQKKQEKLLKEFETKHHKAKNLEQYKQQLTEMDQSFGALVKQLPKDTEVPGLLEDISHTGLGAGLDFDAIELRPEAKREFYVELPISISVKGDYHSFAAFVSGVAALPRIVTLHDFSISRAGAGKGGGRNAASNEQAGLLRMNIIAKTYRYSGKEEEE